MNRTKREQVKQARQEARAMRVELERVLSVPAYQRKERRDELLQLVERLRFLEDLALGRLAGVAEA